MLSEKDPEHYAWVFKPHRLIRALEVCLSTGKPYSSFLNKKKKRLNFQPIYVGLKADREVLYDRINMRVDIMVNEGLCQKYNPLSHTKSAMRYKLWDTELFEYFNKNCSLEESIHNIKKYQTLCQKATYLVSQNGVYSLV